MNALLDSGGAAAAAGLSDRTPLNSAEPARIIDPLRQDQWDSLLAEGGAGCFFHRTAWAQVLNGTYGHLAHYICQFETGRLAQVLPLMEIRSRWTGRRGVSLPFTDFCPLFSRPSASATNIYERALELGRARGWRYLETRGAAPESGATPSVSFYAHQVNLRVDEKARFQALSGAMRRGIRKARAARLVVEAGSTLEAMREFYKLHCQTRRRHGLPPQPVRFFDNIARRVLGSNQGTVLTVRLGARPLAAAVLFWYGAEGIYKFGASDAGFQHLRANCLLMWETLQWCAGRGMERLHLGRTSLANAGLRRFKLALGAEESRLDYYRYDFQRKEFVASADHAVNGVNWLCRWLPQPLLRLAGRMAYPHWA